MGLGNLRDRQGLSLGHCPLSGFLFAETGGYCTCSKDSSAHFQGTFFVSFSLSLIQTQLIYLVFPRAGCMGPPTLGRKCLIPSTACTSTSKCCTISRSIALIVCVALTFMVPECAKLNSRQMLKPRDVAVQGLTEGIELP